MGQRHNHDSKRPEAKNRGLVEPAQNLSDLRQSNRENLDGVSGKSPADRAAAAAQEFDRFSLE